MFVLLIGLLGVAAMIPAGRHEILAGVKLDYASMVGRAAFRDMKIREYTDPEDWRDSNGNGVFNGTTFPAPTRNANSAAPLNTLTPVVAIDPLGLASNFATTFPNSPGTLFLTRLYPSPNAMAAELADPIFRTSDDLILVPSASRDMPPAQQMFPLASPVKRASDGNYSWLATIVSDPTMSALSSKVTISVAVFYKRNLSIPVTGENTASATIIGSGIGGGEVQLSNFSVSPVNLVKPGRWIMLAGTVTSGGTTLNYFRWYRVLAADAINTAVSPNTQFVTLAGADWNPNTTNTTAWIFDNVIAVYEKNMRLELD
jgi:hypothetical protein